MDTNHNVTENVEFWKNLSGLHEDFPKLEPLEANSNDMTLVHIDTKQRKAIEDAIQSNPCTVVQVPKGWGATTLYRYMLYEYTKPSAVRLRIPVALDMESGSFLDADEMEYAIKWQVAKNFLFMLNENALERRYCCDIIGYEEKLDTRGKPEVTYDKYLMLCTRGIDTLEKDSGGFYKQYPFFCQPLHNILNYLLKNLQVQTVFFYLFGSKVSEDKMLSFVHALKQVIDGKHFESAAKKEVFFCTRTVYTDLKREYDRPYELLKYPHYSSAEMYRILAKRHRPTSLRIEGGREEKDSLDTVFPSEMVDRVYKTSKTINKIIADLEKLIEQSLDRPRSEIPYKLTLGAAEEDAS